MYKLPKTVYAMSSTVLSNKYCNGYWSESEPIMFQAIKYVREDTVSGHQPYKYHGWDFVKGEDVKQGEKEYTFHEPHHTGGRAVITITKDEILAFQKKQKRPDVNLSDRELIDAFTSIHWVIENAEI